MSENFSQFAFVVMGVSGCGKSTVGQLLAEQLGVEFIEGDQYHSTDNVQKMAYGKPLNDSDRMQWLAILAEKLAQAKASQKSLVMSCSALKKSYRDILRSGNPNICFVYLQGTFDVLYQRVSERSHQYMPASLLTSQLATLEPPQQSEKALTFDVSQTAKEIANNVVAYLQKPI